MIVGIVGGGISGLALALALQKRKIQSVLWEKDESFEDRKQGYGLTIQQGGKALKKLEILDGIRQVSRSSTSHFIFNEKGEVVIYWGVPYQEVLSKNIVYNANRNLHIARQSLRKVLLQNIDPNFVDIRWGTPINSIINQKSHIFVNDTKVDVLAGCDGIFSNTRKILQPTNELVYLKVFVMLGIFRNASFPLFQERVVQMSDGNTRIFMMPFDENSYMWQLSFNVETIEEATALAKAGNFLAETRFRLKGFTSPIPEMIDITEEDMITGYPVFDRDPLSTIAHEDSIVTLLGDAAHPMSPFKGQGANQALLDAVNLAEQLDSCTADFTLIPAALRKYEDVMVARTISKILGSRECVEELHDVRFIDTQNQLERRGMTTDNDREMIDRLWKMKGAGIGTSDDPSIIDRYAFGGSDATEI